MISPVRDARVVPGQALRLLPAALVFILMVACGGTVAPPPDDAGIRDVSGTVVLPAGTGIVLTTLQAVTGLGSFPVAADGTFTATVMGALPSEIDVIGPDDDLVMVGVVGGGVGDAEVEVSSRSSAAALLYYALGGFMAPASVQDELWDLIDREPAVSDIEAVLSAAFKTGGLPLADESEAVTDALAAAWQTVMAGGPTARTDSAATGSAADRLAVHDASGSITAQAEGAGNVVIEPGAGVLQSGVAVIHNPFGSGVAAQNSFRRPGALLAYQVGYQDDGGADQTITPPILTATVDVPSTGSLGLFQALTDIVKGEAPWSPEVSAGLPLALYQGKRTYYELVLLGPSLDLVTRPPLYDDPRFSGERGHWNDVIGEKAIEQFLNDLALPALETLAFGGVGHVSAGKLAQLRQAFRALNDKHLAGLGVFLREGGSYAGAVKFVITEMASGRGYRTDFMNVMFDAFDESSKNKLSFDAAEKRLAARASAAGIAAAVQLALSAGDVGAMLKDLNDSLPAVGWTATASPTLFSLAPEFGYFSKYQPQVELRVGTRGPVSGTYLYRWSTSGRYGKLTDGPKTGVTIDTAYTNVWFITNAPNAISDDQRDGVWVEVFEVEQGATTIPTGQEPVARLAAELQGFNREIDSRLEVQSGMTAAGYFKDGITVPCTTMYLRIPKQAGVKTYTVSFSGWGGVGNQYNYNGSLYWNHYYDFDIDPTNPDGYIWPFTTVCDWFGPDGTSYAQPIGFKVYDAGGDYLINVFTAMDFIGDRPPDAPTLADYVRFWYDWASQGTVTVTVSK